MIGGAAWACWWSIRWRSGRVGFGRRPVDRTRGPMARKRVLFVGVNADRLASVRIRCVAIAQRLGFDYHLGARRAADIPAGYDVYILVKPEIPDDQLPEIASRGLVLWDVIDRLPPRAGVHRYLASTA